VRQVKCIDLGLKDYKETWDFQQEIQESLIRSATTGSNPGGQACLLFVEHPHVYTLGKSGKENNLLINPEFLASIGATFYKTDRGGDITYHGPGQLVGYPILDLNALGMGVKKYIELLEESIIQTLRHFGIETARLDGATGVWIAPGSHAPGRKICALGVRVSRGITMHGFALNVNTDLNYFRYINPCGFTDKGVTSLEQEVGCIIPMDQVKKLLLENFCKQFGVTIV
jgi:lipoyl(octanoyl) transferase